MTETEPLLRVMSLHALAYCERLFYLEEVEEIRVADKAVFDGRRAHEELADDEITTLVIEAPVLGLKGKLDAVRRKDGRLVPVETKRGKSAPGEGTDSAWRTDQIQVGAYGLLVEEAMGVSVSECLVRYLADKRCVHVPLDERLRREVVGTIQRAGQLRRSTSRPPATPNPRLCLRCSLASVCLPTDGTEDGMEPVPELRLLPEHQDRLTLHVVEDGATVGRKGEELSVRLLDGTATAVPVRSVGAVVVHGGAQITSQAIRLCAESDVSVQWVSGSGFVAGVLAPGARSAQRHLRQFRALSDDATRQRLSRILVSAKVEGQLRFVLRATRGAERSPAVEETIRRIRATLPHIHRSESTEDLLGREGDAASAYFAAMPAILRSDLDPRLVFSGRSRRPSRDRFNTLLNFGYGMLYRECLASIVAVGLHPGFGFYHQPRSAAHPLALDLMEIFRVPLVDMAIVAAVNRGAFDADSDFVESPSAVALSHAGRKKLIETHERRRRDEWRHPVVGGAVDYGRMIELEARLLEKEWTDCARVFARFRLR